MRLLNIIFCSVCTFVFLCNPTFAKSVKFAVVSDVLYNVTTDKNNKNYTEGAKALNGFVDRVNENNYDFVVFLGDSINKSNSLNLKSFLNELDVLNAPYYLVMGNRDVHKISGLSKTEYLNIVQENNSAQKKFKNSYVFYPTPEIAVVVLDNVASGMPSNHGVFTAKTLKWLDETLVKNKNKKVIICQHVPFLAPYDKPSYSLLDKQEYAAVLKRHKNVLMVLAGHYEQDYAVKDEQDVYHITVSALCKPPYTYNEIEVSYQKKLFAKPDKFVIDGNIKPAI